MVIFWRKNPLRFQAERWKQGLDCERPTAPSPGNGIKERPARHGWLGRESVSSRIEGAFLVSTKKSIFCGSPWCHGEKLEFWKFQDLKRVPYFPGSFIQNFQIFWVRWKAPFACVVLGFSLGTTQVMKRCLAFGLISVARSFHILCCIVMETQATSIPFYSQYTEHILILEGSFTVYIFLKYLTASF